MFALQLNITKLTQDVETNMTNMTLYYNNKENFDSNDVIGLILAVLSYVFTCNCTLKQRYNGPLDCLYTKCDKRYERCFFTSRFAMTSDVYFIKLFHNAIYTSMVLWHL